MEEKGRRVVIDRRGKLEGEPFRYRAIKDGRVLIYFEGRLIKTLAGKLAERLLRDIVGREPSEQQLLLARATGHFKHGTER
jgi:hypothetical protein